MFSKNNIQVILIVPENKKDFFGKQFSNNGVVVEGVKFTPGKREALLRYLSLTTIRTRTLDIKRRTEMKGSGTLLQYVIGNRIGRFMVRLIERLSYNHNIFQNLFLQYKPDSVFSTDIQNEIDISLLNEAKKNDIASVGMVRSWDNLTSKGLIRVVPQRLVVWNKIIKNEAIRLHDIKENIVSIIGIPHYDNYNKSKYQSREEFFKKVGVDINKKIILFIPIGDRYLNDNKVDRDIVSILDENSSADYQVLVRLPPGDYVREIENNPDQFKKIKVVYDRGGTIIDNIKMTELSKEDDEHLAETIFWSDVVITGPSTIVIDAAYQDKPTILFGFDGNQKREYFNSIRRYYDYDNFISILQSKGAKFVTSKEEFIATIEEYLADPTRDQNYRKDLVLQQATFIDGKSTERLFILLKEFLN